jgi:hypothetical protein
MSDAMSDGASDDALIRLPDDILHEVFTFIASTPSQVGPCLCWCLRDLSNEWKVALDSEARKDLWSLATRDLDATNTFVAVSELRPTKRPRTTPPPRRSNRLKPTTPKENYIHSYNLLLSRTESASIQIAEHVHSSKNSLSKAKLQRILKDYHPVAINQRVRTGGTILVDVCRARHITERVILACCALLIAEYGCNPNVPSAEFATSEVKRAAFYGPSASTSLTTCSTSTIGRELYPIVIASARGMPTVVELLLEYGANKEAKGTSSFKLYSNPKKTIKGVDLTALEFARKMKDAEIANNIRRADLRGLNKVIALLER